MIRKMTVTYAPGREKQIPMIRVSNKFLVTAGFNVGTAVEVTYGENIITINKLNNRDNNQNHGGSGK